MDLTSDNRNEFHSPHYVALECHLRDPQQHQGPNSHRPGSSNCRSPGSIMQRSGESLTCSVSCDAREAAVQLISNGSLTSHNRHRELKVSGMISRRFRMVTEFLPLTMEGSLFQLWYALARHFWDLSRTVSSVIIVCTAVGLIFYLFILVVGTVSEAFPFQTS